LRRWDVSFEAILASPLVRARQTAELVARGLQIRNRLDLTEHLAPAGDFAQLVRQVNKLRPAPKSVLLVGHEPYLSSLVSLLCTGGSHLTLNFKKGGLCRLEVGTLRCGRCAVIEWLLAPRLLETK
jgi:phosphohistidine phosphatase